MTNNKDVAEFKIILKLAKESGYSPDDALFWYGAFHILKCGMTEEELEKITIGVPKGKVHKGWK